MNTTSLAHPGKEIELMNFVVRNPAVAGAFYPEDPVELRAMVDELLRAASPPPLRVRPLALIAPHAGYVYSGPIAASAFAHVRALRGHFDRVVLLGPAHRVPVRGLATTSASVFRTPMGDVRIDRAGVARAESLHGVKCSDAAHAREHCLEVELPFILATLGDVPVVPLVVGDAAPEDVAAVLEALAVARTLVVVSSDLTHYLDRATAARRDLATTRTIEALDATAIDDDDACGAAPIRGLLVVAKRRGWSVQTLDVRSSGDTAGSRDEVVGYGAYVLGEPLEARAPSQATMRSL
jgi:MEMO1 family protein